ncbi:ABC transporter permease [Paenibacillus thalictri]|uniref:Sugar ABC transporter permease n=1 Tax=Paenibacillus thalictri TaxID=2527873 RepID=A0A4Q9DDD4_9BACL|nr:ABC transporter permease subunit [Paenibacillus thalictri]TBL69108.1 sugar ABC transporter permease [Paenibacillus thalictri]
MFASLYKANLSAPTANSNKKNKLGKSIVKYWQLYVLILPAVTTVFIFHYIPIYGVQIAFRNYSPVQGFFGSEWVGLNHFIRFFTYTDFWKIMRNTLVISLYSLATFPLPVILALMINEVSNKSYKRYVQMISYAPHFVSTVVICSMIILFTQYDGGLFNNIRLALGMEKIDIITNPKYLPSIYVWSGVWQNIGWETIIYLAALSNLSPELIEAAKIDGAGRMRTIINISYPSIRPIILVMLILSTGRVLSVGFEKIFLLQNSLNLDTSRVISTYVYEVGILGGQFSYSSAIGLFDNIINIIIIIFVNKISKKLTSTSLW